MVGDGHVRWSSFWVDGQKSGYSRRLRPSGAAGGVLLMPGLVSFLERRAEVKISVVFEAVWGGRRGTFDARFGLFLGMPGEVKISVASEAIWGTKWAGSGT